MIDVGGAVGYVAVGYGCKWVIDVGGIVLMSKSVGGMVLMLNDVNETGGTFESDRRPRADIVTLR